MSIETLKSQINLDCPDERDVIRALFVEANTNEPRGFLDVFTDEEIMRMWGSDEIWNWSTSNRDWLIQTVHSVLDQHQAK